MRAVVFAAVGELTVAERPEPVPGPREVVIETAAVGICGTDTHVLDGEFEGTMFPLVPGHEATGTVVALGPGADEGPNALAVGDHVAVNPSSTCGECDLCLTGRQNLCRAWNGMGVVRADGAAQQRFTAPVANVFRLRPDTDVFEAALIEPLACAIHGWDVLPRRMADHVLVYGSGTMGLLMAQLAPRAGAASVTIIDVNPDRLVTAAEVGIEHRYTSMRRRGPRGVGRGHRLHREHRRDPGRPPAGHGRRRVPALRRGTRRRHRTLLAVPGIP